MTRLAAFSILVPEYDAGVLWFTSALGFTVAEDVPQAAGKRWVRLRAPSGGSDIILARAATPEQRAAIGRQGGGRVWLFLETDDFDRDHARILSGGGTFLESPRLEPYGTVAVFADPWGNRWDLIQPPPLAKSDTPV